MGVRGKIEAVIYAAEEPVTLQQLTSLFGEEVLTEREAERRVEPGPAEGADEPEARTDTNTPEEEHAQETNGGAIDQAALPRGDEAAWSGEPRTPPVEPTEATGEPAPVGDTDSDRRAARLRERATREAVRDVLDALVLAYENNDRGMEIREIAGGYRVATKPEYHDAVRAFARSLKPPMKLSLQALETLAVIAYKQPVTSPEVSEIRGVDSGGVLGSLINRKLVTTAGRKPVVGRPILYKTTKEFLLRFGLKDLAELPSMEEFEKMAGELQAQGEEPEAAEALQPPAATAPLLPEVKTPPETEPEGPVIAIDAAGPEQGGLSVEEDGGYRVDRGSVGPPTDVEKAAE